MQSAKDHTLFTCWNNYIYSFGDTVVLDNSYCTYSLDGMQPISIIQ